MAPHVARQSRNVLRPTTWLGIFFFNDTATTEIYTLSLHDALPISCVLALRRPTEPRSIGLRCPLAECRSEEHTSELQSPFYLVCRLLLEKEIKVASRGFLEIHSTVLTRPRGTVVVI